LFFIFFPVKNPENSAFKKLFIAANRVTATFFGFWFSISKFF